MYIVRIIKGVIFYFFAVHICFATKLGYAQQVTNEVGAPPALSGFSQPQKPHLSLSPFVIPILDKSNPYRTVYVRLTLTLKDDTWHIARVYTPYIYHALFKDLYYAFNFFWRGNVKPDLQVIRKRMLYAYKRSFNERWPIKDIVVHEIVVDHDEPENP